MALIRAEKPATLVMYEESWDLERNVQEIVRKVRRTMNVLAASDNRPDPVKYLAVIRSMSELREMWKRHIDTESALFPMVLDYDSSSAISLSRIIEENEAIEKLLASLVAAPWPRSAQAGLLSIRIRANEVLNHLLAQVEQERVAIPLEIFRSGRRPASHLFDRTKGLIESIFYKHQRSIV